MYKEKFIHSPWVIGILFALWFIFFIPPIIAIVLIVKRNQELKKMEEFWKENKFDEVINFQ